MLKGARSNVPPMSMALMFVAAVGLCCAARAEPFHDYAGAPVFMRPARDTETAPLQDAPLRSSVEAGASVAWGEDDARHSRRFRQLQSAANSTATPSATPSGALETAYLLLTVSEEASAIVEGSVVYNKIVAGVAAAAGVDAASVRLRLVTSRRSAKHPDPRRVPSESTGRATVRSETRDATRIAPGVRSKRIVAARPMGSSELAVLQTRRSTVIAEITAVDATSKAAQVVAKPAAELASLGIDSVAVVNQDGTPISSSTGSVGTGFTGGAVAATVVAIIAVIAFGTAVFLARRNAANAPKRGSVPDPPGCGVNKRGRKKTSRAGWGSSSDDGSGYSYDDGDVNNNRASGRTQRGPKRGTNNRRRNGGPRKQGGARKQGGPRKQGGTHKQGGPPRRGNKGASSKAPSGMRRKTGDHNAGTLSYSEGSIDFHGGAHPGKGRGGGKGVSGGQGNEGGARRGHRNQGSKRAAGDDVVIDIAKRGSRGRRPPDTVDRAKSARSGRNRIARSGRGARTRGDEPGSPGTPAMTTSLPPGVSPGRGRVRIDESRNEVKDLQHPTHTSGGESEEDPRSPSGAQRTPKKKWGSGSSPSKRRSSPSPGRSPSPARSPSPVSTPRRGRSSPAASRSPTPRRSPSPQSSGSRRENDDTGSSDDFWGGVDNYAATTRSARRGAASR